MKSEVKICLPVYKIVYSVCYVVMLALVRGISDTREIGITLDAFMAVLAIVFCADTLQMEYDRKRWEIFFLRPQGQRRRALGKRLALQCAYLWLLSAAGYACFYWQRPVHSGDVPQAGLFFLFFAAVAVSIFFWSACAFALTNLCRNTLAGIGISVFAWLFANSTAGERMLGNFSVFSFVFRDMEHEADLGWLAGKALAALFAMLLAAYSIKKRG